jgi:hypothetical protein
MRSLFPHRNGSLFRSDHFRGVLVEQRAVLHFDQGVAGLFQNGHELKDCEGSAVLQVEVRVEGLKIKISTEYYRERGSTRRQEEPDRSPNVVLGLED